MSNLIVFPHQKLKNYLKQALAGFARDPPDTDSQCGYQDALQEIYRVFFQKKL